MWQGYKLIRSPSLQINCLGSGDLQCLLSRRIIKDADTRSPAQSSCQLKFPAVNLSLYDVRYLRNVSNALRVVYIRSQLLEASRFGHFVLRSLQNGSTEANAATVTQDNLFRARR